MDNSHKASRIDRFGSLHWAHWLIIGLSLLLTFFAWYFSQKNVDEKRMSSFKREAEQVIEIIQERMVNYEDTLWAGVATIQANGGAVTYLKWKDYVDNLNLLKKYPGINGLGIIYSVKPNQLSSYFKEQRIQRPKYDIHPPHKQKRYLPITYIIPVKGNEKAVGLDMAHESNRFTAALKAESTGLAQITGPITLVQDREKTPGFLFYAPFYKDDNDATENLRRDNFLGMVYAPFIVKKLMSGVLDKANRHVSIKITDANHVLYNEHTTDGEHHDAQTEYKFAKNVKVYGRIWTFDIWGSQSFNNAITNTQPITILIGGIIIDLLLTALFLTISSSNKRAISYANSMTSQLKDKTKVLEESNFELNKTKQQLEKMAHYDLLTGLPNRHSFQEYLKKSLARAKCNSSLLAVCFLDLDNFKSVNDNMGHKRGDMLLQFIPKILAPKLRDIDYLARLSGDEFGLILENIQSSSEAASIIDRYLKLFKQTINIDNYEITTSASIGIAMYPTGGNNPDELIKHADIAMYNAKEAGKNTFRFFNDETNHQVKRRHTIEVGLRKAIRNNEFSLVYQPQVDAQTNKIYGAEALVRWHNDALDNIGPAEFIPIAEECGMIKNIGEWVIDRVGQDFSSLKKIRNDFKISINVSIRQLENNSFYNVISDLLQQYNLPPQNIALEVTETAIMQDPELTLDLMNRLTEIGISFALDDFGVGYSSMTYLKQLPISYIKIDQSFVGDIEQDPSDAAIVKTIIQLSNALGTKTIAEGVETKGEHAYLQQQGCDYLQGYCIDKPMPLENLVEKYTKDKSES